MGQSLFGGVRTVRHRYLCWFSLHKCSSKFNFLTYTAAAAAKSLQSCPTLCDPTDGSLPGSAVPGILQARTLEWVAISFSNAWKWKVKVKSFSHVRLLVTPWTAGYQAPPSMGFSRQSPSPSQIDNWTEILINSLGKNLLLVTSHNIYIRDILKLENSQPITFTYHMKSKWKC